MGTAKGEVTVEGALLRYFANIIDAIKDVETYDVYYGQYHISRVSIQFDGEDTNYSIGYGPDSEGMSLIITDPYVVERHD